MTKRSPNTAEGAMIDPPMVSIALATFRGAKYLGGQLDSFLAQTRPPDEVVISDDASDDGTVEMCRAFADSAPFPVRVLTSDRNMGVVRNFERALRNCGGDLVFLSDQDDVWYPSKIEVVLEHLHRNPSTSLAIHDLRICHADMAPTGDTKLRRIARLYDPERRYITGMATVIRRRFLDLALPFPRIEGLWHDRWLHECAHVLGIKRVVPHVLADYRRHGSNVTHGSSVNSPGLFAGFQAVLEPLGRDVGVVEIRAATWRAVRAWLMSHEGALVDERVASTADIEAAMSKLDWEIGMAERRARILRSPRIRRFPGVLSLWRDGGYKPFSGAKSALADLIRP